MLLNLSNQEGVFTYSMKAMTLNNISRGFFCGSIKDIATQTSIHHHNPHSLSCPSDCTHVPREVRKINGVKIGHIATLASLVIDVVLVLVASPFDGPRGEPDTTTASGQGAVPVLTGGAGVGTVKL
jgi:hypothetical protein